VSQAVGDILPGVPIFQSQHRGQTDYFPVFQMTFNLVTEFGAEICGVEGAGEVQPGSVGLVMAYRDIDPDMPGRNFTSAGNLFFFQIFGYQLGIKVFETAQSHDYVLLAVLGSSRQHGRLGQAGGAPST